MFCVRIDALVKRIFEVRKESGKQSKTTPICKQFAPFRLTNLASNKFLGIYAPEIYDFFVQ